MQLGFGAEGRGFLLSHRNTPPNPVHQVGDRLAVWGAGVGIFFAPADDLDSESQFDHRVEEIGYPGLDAGEFMRFGWFHGTNGTDGSTRKARSSPSERRLTRESASLDWVG